MTILTQHLARVLTSLIFSSTSGSRSSRQAAMKTPPAKQEEKLISILHLILEDTSGLCLSWEKSLRGIIPNRKVMTVMASRVITYREMLPIRKYRIPALPSR